MDDLRGIEHMLSETCVRNAELGRPVERLIRALFRLTIVFSIVGGAIFLGAVVTLPILGFAAAEFAAFGIWTLLLGALVACLLLAAVIAGRVRTGRWYFGG